MTELLVTASLLTAAAAVLVGAVFWTVTRSIRIALPITLELLTGAGLLRLSSENTWQAIGTAAAVIAIRKVVHMALRRERPAPGGGPAGVALIRTRWRPCRSCRT